MFNLKFEIYFSNMTTRCQTFSPLSLAEVTGRFFLQVKMLFIERLLFDKLAITDQIVITCIHIHILQHLGLVMQPTPQSQKLIRFFTTLFLFLHSSCVVPPDKSLIVLHSSRPLKLLLSSRRKSRCLQNCIVSHRTVSPHDQLARSSNSSDVGWSFLLYIS